MTSSSSEDPPADVIELFTDTAPGQHAPVGMKSALKAREAPLRELAAVHFITSSSSLTIDQMHAMPEFSSVPLARLKAWANEGSWQLKRNAFFNKLASQTRQKFESDLMKARQRDLGDLERLRRRAIEHLDSESVQPKSWEGVAKALLDTMKIRETITQTIAAELGPAPQDKITPESVGTTPEELQLAAKAILAARRTKDPNALAPAILEDAAGSSTDQSVQTDRSVQGAVEGEDDELDLEDEDEGDLP